MKSETKLSKMFGFWADFITASSLVQMSGPAMLTGQINLSDEENYSFYKEDSGEKNGNVEHFQSTRNSLFIHSIFRKEKKLEALKSKRP